MDLLLNILLSYYFYLIRYICITVDGVIVKICDVELSSYLISNRGILGLLKAIIISKLSIHLLQVYPLSRLLTHPTLTTYLLAILPTPYY
jgi:hypothetical protein